MTSLEANLDISMYKIPPQNIEAEQSLLGGILLENNAINKVLEVIGENDFYRESHRKIFAGILELYEKNRPADLITVTDLLKNKGLLEEIGGAYYLASLVDNVPSAANIVYYARIVKEKSILRTLINAATDIITEGYNNPSNIDNFLDEAERRIFEISENRVKPSFFHIKELIKESFKFIEKRYERKELITGIPTGFIDIDNLTSGLQPSDLVIIAGRPSMGKTAFSLNIAQNAAIRNNIPVAIFSLEMSKEQLVLRMLSSEAKIEGSRLRKGFLSERDWTRLTNAAGLLSEAPIFIDDTPAISILELRAKSRRLKGEHNIKLIILDYLQLMKGPKNVDSREKEISEISRSLKALAKELNIPVIALSQLSRKVEERRGNRPQLADLRESGAIEQDADLILFLYRDEVYNRDTEDSGIAEVIIGKQRNGPIGIVKLTFLSEYTKFDNLAREEQV
jgi:replicative DNA helicase